MDTVSIVKRVIEGYCTWSDKKLLNNLKTLDGLGSYIFPLRIFS
jgi:hypothetical protein